MKKVASISALLASLCKAQLDPGHKAEMKESMHHIWDSFKEYANMKEDSKAYGALTETQQGKIEEAHKFVALLDSAPADPDGYEEWIKKQSLDDEATLRNGIDHEMMQLFVASTGSKSTDTIFNLLNGAADEHAGFSPDGNIGLADAMALNAGPEKIHINDDPTDPNHEDALKAVLNWGKAEGPAEHKAFLQMDKKGAPSGFPGHKGGEDNSHGTFFAPATDGDHVALTAVKMQKVAGVAHAIPQDVATSSFVDVSPKAHNSDERKFIDTAADLEAEAAQQKDLAEMIANEEAAQPRHYPRVSYRKAGRQSGRALNLAH